MTPERWQRLTACTWFRAEQDEVIAYVEELRYSLDEAKMDRDLLRICVADSCGADPATSTTDLIVEATKANSEDDQQIARLTAERDEAREERDFFDAERIKVAMREEEILAERDAALAAANVELRHRADHATPDHPGYDGTDAAHPAWWRGDEHGSSMVADVLRGVAERGKVGTFGGEKVERAALAIDALRSALIRSESLRTVRCDELSETIRKLEAELSVALENRRDIPAGCGRCPYCTAVRKLDELADHVTTHCLSNPLRLTAEQR